MISWPGSFGLCKFLLAAVLLLACQPAFAGKRVAFVLGNSLYQNVPRLANPVNDAALIAAKLKEAGFDVVDSRHDLSALETRRALRDFEDSARDADIAVIYYAGHGIEVDGTNYLIPVDAKLQRDSDVYDEALSLDRILVAVEPAKRLRLVILDACRDNPFSQTMKRTLVSRSIGRGLAKVEPTSPNTLIAYSAKAGSTALDGDGKDSPFTMALAGHLTTPGLDVRKAFGFVRDDVLKATGNRQEPFVYGSLGGEDVALVPGPNAAAPALQGGPNPQADVRRDYELALQVGNSAAMNAFLAQHPNGFYANLAHLELDKIAREEAQGTAAEKAREAERQRARQAAAGAENGAQAKAEADIKAAEAARQAADGNKPAAPPASDKPVNVAALAAGSPPEDLTKSVQLELRRVGCFDAAADGRWSADSQRSLRRFNRYAGTKFDAKIASTEALDAIKQKRSRVCPLVCAHGFRAEADRCSRIVCAEGSFLNADNECEKRRGRTPVARGDEGRQEHQSTARTPKPEAARRGQDRRQDSGSGQIVCSTVGCRHVSRGCHIAFKTTAQGGPVEGGGGNVEVCP
ncbi:MAG: caspase family protein [Gemmatimonas sp.]